MVRPPSIDSNGMKKGAWSEEEDNKLRAYVLRYGHWNWRLLPKYAGLARCKKSCRLRWVNYLQPGLRKGNFSKEEEDLIIELHNQLGNKWSAIAANFPGRTDNDIKNHWHAHIKKRTRVATRVICAEIEQSSETNLCKKPYQQEETTTFDATTSSPEITNPLDGINGHDLSTKVYDLPILFPKENFPVSGLCHKDTPTFSDSGDGTYDHLSPILDNEFFEFGLCPNDIMSTFSDSSEGGINSRSKYEYGDDTIDMVLWQ